MITLYHCMSARSFRPLWALEELRLPYSLVVLPFPPRTLARAYLETNPLGTVPAFFDGELRMTESAAICQYLAAKHSPGALDVAPAEDDYGGYLNWLHFGEATLTSPQSIVLRYSRFETGERRVPQVVEDYTRWFLGRLRGIEAALADRPWLCAGRFTAADISVGYALMLAAQLGLAPRFAPVVDAYWTRLQARDGYRRALEAQERAALEQGVSTAHAAHAAPPP